MYHNAERSTAAEEVIRTDIPATDIAKLPDADPNDDTTQAWMEHYGLKLGDILMVAINGEVRRYTLSEEDFGTRIIGEKTINQEEGVRAPERLRPHRIESNEDDLQAEYDAFHDQLMDCTSIDELLQILETKEADVQFFMSAIADYYRQQDGRTAEDARAMIADITTGAMRQRIYDVSRRNYNSQPEGEALLNGITNAFGLQEHVRRVLTQH